MNNMIMYIPIVVFGLLLGFITCNFNETFHYEKIHKHGMGRRMIEDYRHLNPRRNYGYEHPEPLPTDKSVPYVMNPYHSIVQGRRRAGDYRAFSNKFNYEATIDRDHHYFCEGLLDCFVTYLLAETNGGIPILLRGGVGYRHFRVIARAHAGNNLTGKVQAYCMKTSDQIHLRYGSSAET